MHTFCSDAVHNKRHETVSYCDHSVAQCCFFYFYFLLNLKKGMLYIMWKYYKKFNTEIEFKKALGYLQLQVHFVQCQKKVHRNYLKSILCLRM